MLNQEFCEFLEFEITKALGFSKDEQLKGFWCDGVLLPHGEDEYSKKHVNDKGEIVMTAFAGKTGQDKYELTLLFGIKALSRYGNSELLAGTKAERKLQFQADEFQISVIRQALLIR